MLVTIEIHEAGANIFRSARPGPPKVKKEPGNRCFLGRFGLQKVHFLKITPKSAIFDGEMRSKSGQFYVTLGQVLRATLRSGLAPFISFNPASRLRT